jgi:hypothetical protein
MGRPSFPTTTSSFKDSILNGELDSVKEVECHVTKNLSIICALTSPKAEVVGALDGISVGVFVGIEVGESVGKLDFDGEKVGGALVGALDVVGDTLGNGLVGMIEMVGCDDGNVVGCEDGEKVGGVFVGALDVVGDTLGKLDVVGDTLGNGLLGMLEMVGCDDGNVVGCEDRNGRQLDASRTA